MVLVNSRGSVSLRIVDNRVYDHEGRFVYTKNGNYICNAEGYWVYEIRGDKVFNTQDQWMYQLYNDPAPVPQRPPEVRQASVPPTARAEVGAVTAAHQHHMATSARAPKMTNPIIIGAVAVVVLIIALVIIFSRGSDNGDDRGYAMGGNDSDLAGSDYVAQYDNQQDSTAYYDYDATHEPYPAYYQPEYDTGLYDGFTGFYQFTNIALGTHVDNALSALGEPTSTMTMDVLGAETTTKSWWTSNFFRLPSSETVTFTNGYATSVVSTADASSSISAYEFNQVYNGMSETDVFNILGAPYSVTIVEVMGSISITVMWINADFSSGSVTFTDGVVSAFMAMSLD